ncbi:hypothetical protein PENTCL1PPCAC_13602, partial [Pristionchus entomophagus]
IFPSFSINQSEMDIFALPDVCLREVMKRVTLKDRLRLRLVCRAFEQLVADTNAGRFESGCIRRWTDDIRHGRRGSVDEESGVLIRLDDLEVKLKDETLFRLLQLRNRLFSGISFECFELKVSIFNSSDFVLKFLNNFKIENLHFEADSDFELQNARRMMAALPICAHTLSISSLSDSEKLMPLPPMDNLKLFYGCAQIPTERFFKLLSTHKNMLVTSDSVKITPQEWIRVMQIISDDHRTREVKLRINRSTIKGWLLNFGITNATRASGTSDEVNVTHPLNDEGEIRLRYKTCLVRITYFDWTDNVRHSIVRMTNRLE